jgi:hypothetical protein
MSRSIAPWVLVLFVLWQIGVSAHLVLVPHVLRADGVIVDVHKRSDGETPGRECPDPLEDECPVLSQLTGVNMLAPEPIVFWLAVSVLAPFPVPAGEQHVVDGRELFRISPSLSPPTHA